jgi:hypothetical protein
MRIGRKCPEVQGDILEIMLLVSQIQAHVGIDHGYRHAHRMIARVRNPRLGRSHPGGARRAPSGRERDLEPVREKVELDESVVIAWSVLLLRRRTDVESRDPPHLRP